MPPIFCGRCHFPCLGDPPLVMMEGPERLCDDLFGFQPLCRAVADSLARLSMYCVRDLVVLVEQSECSNRPGNCYLPKAVVFQEHEYAIVATDSSLGSCCRISYGFAWRGSRAGMLATPFNLDSCRWLGDSGTRIHTNCPPGASAALMETSHRQSILSCVCPIEDTCAAWRVDTIGSRGGCARKSI